MNDAYILRFSEMLFNGVVSDDERFINKKVCIIFMKVTEVSWNWLISHVRLKLHFFTIQTTFYFSN